MRKTLSLACLIVVLGVAMPAQAQLRQDLPLQEQAPMQLYDQGGAAFSLNKFFSPAHFQMRHAVEMSMGSFGGQTSSLGMYTNTMMWQFNQKLAARVDVAFAYSPFNDPSQVGPNQLEQNNGRVFLRNAEIAYRPTKNMLLHIQVRQSPYGRYASPYGAYGGGYGYGMNQVPQYDLFWNDGLR